MKPEQLTLREMTPTDIETVTAMEAACFGEPWSEAGVRGELETNPFSHGWLLEDEGTPAAYAFLWETFETGQIARIAVMPDYRRKGVGRRLLQDLKERASQAGCEFLRLEVRESNLAAQGLYEEAGFLKAGITKHYYSNGESAIVMALPLESEEPICW